MLIVSLWLKDRLFRHDCIILSFYLKYFTLYMGTMEPSQWQPDPGVVPVVASTTATSATPGGLVATTVACPSNLIASAMFCPPLVGGLKMVALTRGVNDP